MSIKSLIKTKFRSLNECAEKCSIPYATLHDICSGKTNLEDCECATVLRLSKGLGVTVEELVLSGDFNTFRNNMHHQLKEYGDMDFLLKHLDERTPLRLMKTGEKLQALYLVCMIDHLSIKHGIPLACEFDKIRGLTMDRPFYVGDSGRFDDRKEALWREAIPVFRDHNIIEGDLYDAV